MRSSKVGVVDFPTLGHLADWWITRHCKVPDRHVRGAPFRQYDWQFWCTANHFRVRDDAENDPAEPLYGDAFVYRRSDVIAAQKLGKGPWAAVLLAFMAVGPSEFGGRRAGAGEWYVCADNGCPCGGAVEYEPGDPIGIRHPSPLLQALASSQEQVRNVWRPLTAMIRLPKSRLAPLLLDRTEFIRVVIPGSEPGQRDYDLDRIDAVTSSAQSRLGNPISGYVQDETGTHTDSNGMARVDSDQRRGAAGMIGRGFTTTNSWDTSQQSVAQRDYEVNAPDVFTFYSPPPKKLDFYDDEERRLILAHNYGGSTHNSVEAIDAECVDMIARGDGPLAERFFGNRPVEVKGSWMAEELWEAAYAEYAVAS